jgi:hypothetical protein
MHSPAAAAAADLTSVERRAAVEHRILVAAVADHAAACTLAAYRAAACTLRRRTVDRAWARHDPSLHARVSRTSRDFPESHARLPAARRSRVTLPAPPSQPQRPHPADRPSTAAALRASQCRHRAARA